MGFINSKKICPFKEDNELIKKIDERPIHLDSIILAITKFPELLNINNKN